MIAYPLPGPPLRESWLKKLSVTLTDECPVPGPCWIWNGYVDKQSGYGRVYIDHRCLYLHRVSYERFSGPIPPGLEIDHLCRQRACCAPYHLEAVTPKVNVSRGLVPKNRCPRGHEYNGENLIITTKTKGGPRKVCKTCRTEYMAEYREMRRKQREQTWTKYLGGAA